MKFASTLTLVVAVGFAASLAGCGTSSRQLTEMEDSQVNLRTVQSRAFDSTDKNRMLRTVIATL